MRERNRMRIKKRKRLKKFTLCLKLRMIKTVFVKKNEHASEINDCKKNICFIKKHVFKLLKLKNIIVTLTLIIRKRL